MFSATLELNVVVNAPRRSQDSNRPYGASLDVVLIAGNACLASEYIRDKSNPLRGKSSHLRTGACVLEATLGLDPVCYLRHSLQP